MSEQNYIRFCYSLLRTNDGSERARCWFHAGEYLHFFDLEPITQEQKDIIQILAPESFHSKRYTPIPVETARELYSALLETIPEKNLTTENPTL